MPKRIRIELNSAGIKEVLRAPGVVAELKRLAVPIEAAAKASAPVKTGTYRDSIHIEESTTDRAAVHIVADSPNAMLVESRTGNMARALDAAGG